MKIHTFVVRINTLKQVFIHWLIKIYIAEKKVSNHCCIYRNGAVCFIGV